MISKPILITLIIYLSLIVLSTSSSIKSKSSLSSSKLYKRTKLTSLKSKSADSNFTIPLSSHNKKKYKKNNKLSPLPNYSDELLNIHMVSHSHDDVGYKKTVDQYYMGLNNTIYYAGVQYVLDTVIQELSVNINRKFMYVEIAFFERWWNEQTKEKKELTTSLIQSKQLEFVNAGYCMNDEASASYTDIIDQMTLGHQFIRDTFGEEYLPTIAWQIDPFGHSNEQANLFSEMGMDAVYFARIDYQDRALRIANSTLEYIWRPSPTFGTKTQIFTGVFYTHYTPPPGFCFESPDVDPIQDDPMLENYNVDVKAQEFADYCHFVAKSFVGNHVMLTMGSDFAYQNANIWFKNMEKLMKYFSANPELGLNVFYSNPSIYTAAKNSLNATWTVKYDDNFPYCMTADTCWTGYFTTRPTLKGYIADMSSFLQVCKQFDVFANMQGRTTMGSPTLIKAMAVAQHHDAVTGTSKQAVAYDYAFRLSNGEASCVSTIQNDMNSFTSATNFAVCTLLNISSCVSENWDGNSFLQITLYNPLAMPVNDVVTIPMIKLAFTVMDSTKSPVAFQINELSAMEKHLQGLYSTSTANYAVSFPVSLPTVGYATYLIVPTSEPSAVLESVSAMDDIVMESNDYLINVSNGLMTSITNKLDSSSISINQGWYWYYAMNYSAETQEPGSGAYVFRPQYQMPFEITLNSTSYVKGIVFDELTSQFGEYVEQKIRLYHFENTVTSFTMSYTVGPVPVDDYIGKEIIVRFNTSINSGGVIYTDANGRAMQKRIFNYRPTWNLDVVQPVSGNYYPMSMSYIEDANTRFTTVSDRSQGGGSLGNGEIEIMTHRRLLSNEIIFGIQEDINEVGPDGLGLIMKGNMKLMVSSPANGANLLRTNYLVQRNKPVVMVSSDLNSITPVSFLAKGVSFPKNVHLQTVEVISSGVYRVRIAHLYEADEDPVLSQPVSIDLNIFESTITSINEISLSGNSNMRERMTWNTVNDLDHNDLNITKLEGTTIIINPMQIRTFEVSVSIKGN